MKKYILILFFIVANSLYLLGNDGENIRKFSLVDSTEQRTQLESKPRLGLFEGRKLSASIYSLIIPGSGQTMLGSPYKGFGFTFLAFGSALTTLISYNNSVASNEQLDALEFYYKSSTTWENSNALYTSMKDTHTKLLRYRKMKNTFALVSAIVWTLNIADILFNTDDEGETIFSSISVSNSSPYLAAGVFDQQQIIRFSIPLD